MNALRIFADPKLSDAALQLLKEGVAPHEIVLPDRPAASVLVKSETDPAFATTEIAFGQPAVASILASERLRWVHLTSAGYTRYDTPEFRSAAAARGLIMTNSSTVYAEACAEHVLAFMLAQARRLPLALGTRTASGTPRWLELRNAGTILRHQRVVILGFGAIAWRLAELLKPFDVEIVAMRRTPRGNEELPVVTQEQLPHALARADHVISILPENAESAGFIDAGRLSLMKAGAVFYNIGRGTTVDQQALLDALRSGHLTAAWLDVTDPEPLPSDHPLLAQENCFITPHTAGGHQNESETLVRHFLENFRRYLGGVPLKDRVM